MLRDEITVRLAGESGEGVISGGDILTTGAARTGYWGLTFRTYPAEIKGGPCMYQVRIGTDALRSQGNTVDLLICFNQEAFDLHHRDLADDGHIVCDAESVRVTPKYESRSSEAPLGALAQEAGGSRRGKNLVAVGLVCGLLGIDTTQIEEFILKRYAHKGDVGEANIKSLRAGFEFAQGKLPDGAHKLRPPSDADGERLLLSGNQAICIGALAAGLNYFAGYPITPASDILEWLSSRLPRFGGVAIQTEDEIAALASVLGASYAGRKAMTATSGPGLSLMAELVGLAGMAEIPAVIIDAQRSGPSTGMPTKTEQSDLNHALYGGHGEAPRIVMAPTTVEDCFTAIVEAFNAAERYQAPVILLSDQSLSHRMETVPRPDLGAIEVVDRVTADGAENGSYNRYRIADDGISPMAVPGGPGAYVSTGIEHDEAGHPHYEPELHEAMMTKRFGKLEPLAAEGRITFSGPDRADVGILGWGSTEGASLEAAQILLDRGLKVSTCYPRVLAPLPVERIREWAEGMERVVVPELNVTGQFARLVRGVVEISVESMTKASGLPFTAAQIADYITDDTQPVDHSGVWKPGMTGQARVG
ncbi:MAG: 2-oxoacid:acceptor oxidoreductase subunit alpha [Solirubrobacterales bacterium]